ncbi:MAG: adenylosuccinate lyase, partial [Candidatus Lokiarchaeota archaeon]|nr:adenylosuccinate lyase [Candidatus Lokiarchaeota archaeon]
TNSASERVIFAENFILLDYMIKQLTQNLRGLEFNEIKIEENLNLTKGACLTEKFMVQLVKKGIGRQEGHEILRQTSIRARNENLYMKDILFENNQIKERFTKKELEEIFDPHKYIGKAVEQVENLIEFLKNKYKF